MGWGPGRFFLLIGGSIWGAQVILADVDRSTGFGFYPPSDDEHGEPAVSIVGPSLMIVQGISDLLLVRFPGCRF